MVVLSVHWLYYKRGKNEESHEGNRGQAKEYRNKQTKERTNEGTKERSNEQTNERTKERTNEGTNERQNERTDKRTHERQNERDKIRKAKTKTYPSFESSVGTVFFDAATLPFVFPFPPALAFGLRLDDDGKSWQIGIFDYKKKTEYLVA